MLEEKEFWALIEESKDAQMRNDWLKETLIQKKLDEILDFEIVFKELMNKSYQSHLWGAAFFLMGGCSDDAFDYFRGWLIGQGEETYNHVINDPEYLAEYISEDNLDEEGYPQNEKILAVGVDAYCLLKIGVTECDAKIYDEMLEKLEKKGAQPKKEIELDWKEDDLEKLFPVLWDRFGDTPLGS